ncbi:hypothetical protein GCM10011591_17210 [Nocardia camponoti]|uniref:DUF320 domain-containing protein n=2 Tax=Nocardia camponoti TaxID=1616106 RepID=A0A917V6J5_9NOCA|nr:hypothetical protein GCM10011591_17210 [Nocardia camponoti]
MNKFICATIAAGTIATVGASGVAQAQPLPVGAPAATVVNTGSNDAIVVLSSATGALLIPIILPLMCVHYDVDCIALGSSWLSR